jgi:glycerol-3-phosphate dehydrogenase (NAD(P)+)
MKHVCVLGDGAWGTAIATLLADNGHEVILWCHDKEVAHDIQTNHRNTKYLPDHIVPQAITATTDIKQAVCGAQWIFEAVPVAFLRSVVELAALCVIPEQTWVVLSKGIEKDTLLLPTQIIDDVVGFVTKKAVFSGPSFAKDLIKKQITAVTLATIDCERGLQLQQLLANDYFRPYLSLDMVGVQCGGAFKNGIALAVGMLDGLACTDNVKSFLLTRGLHEMVQLSVALGGKQETLYGLSGVGDLVLTAMGSLSKNRAFGKKLGSGIALEQARREVATVPEGVNTTASVQQLARKHSLKLPLYQALYAILFDEKKPAHLLDVLVNSPLESECLIKQ